MKALLLAVAAFSLFAGSHVLADPNAKVRPALEQKIIGVWEGQTGCAGNFAFRADGTYELTNYGPAPIDSSGTWKVQGDSLPAVLVLNCKKSDVKEEEGKTLLLTLVRVDDDGLAVKHGNQYADRYGRMK